MKYDTVQKSQSYKSTIVATWLTTFAETTQKKKKPIIQHMCHDLQTCNFKQKTSMSEKITCIINWKCNCASDDLHALCN